MHNLDPAQRSKKEILFNALYYGFQTALHRPVLWLKVLMALILTFGIALAALMGVFMTSVIMLYTAVVQQTPPIINYYLLITGAVLSLAGMLFLFLVVFAGGLRFIMQLHDQGHADIKTLFSGFGYALRFVGLAGISLMLLAGLLAILALIYLPLGVYNLQDLQIGLMLQPVKHLIAAAFAFIGIIATLFVGYRLSYPWYILVDQNTGIITAVKKSWSLTNGCVLMLIALSIVTTVPSTLATKITEPLVDMLLDKDGYVSIALAFVVQLLGLLVSFVCAVANVSARVRIYRLLQARR